MITCPSCGLGLLSPIMKSKPFLIVKESITGAELDAHQIFLPSWENKHGYEEKTPNYYFGKELGLQGLNINTFSLSCLYMHNPPKGGRDKVSRERIQKCTDHSVAELIGLAKNMKIILMMGAETIKTFTGYNASDVYGLVCKSDLLPNVPTIIPCPNSDKLMNQSIGEFRVAIKTLAEQIKIYNNYMEIS